MSKLTKAIALLAPLGSESDPLHGFFDPERRKAMRTLLNQIENDRRQIAQLNAKHQARDRQFRNLKSRHAYAQAALDEKIKELGEKVADQAAALKMQASAIESISRDRNYWQGEARRLEAALEGSAPGAEWVTKAAHDQIVAALRERLLKYEVPDTSSTEYVDPVQPGQTIEYKPGIEPTNERLLRLKEEAEEKLARISEIVGTTDVPEITLLARRQLPLEAVLVDLFDAKLKAVAEILDED